MSFAIAALTVVVVAVLSIVAAMLVQLIGARALRVECPATHHEARVRLDERKSLRALFVDGTPACVVGCSRWPGAAGCDRACEKSIAT